MGFMDKVAVGFNKGVAAVSENSKGIVEKAKLNKQIYDIEKRRNVLLNNMGELIYNLQAAGTIQIQQCEEVCTEIDKCSEQILRLKKELNALEQHGANDEIYEITPDDGSKCECGFVNTKTASFCRMCGKPLKDNNDAL